jgi:hypothetical protein
MIDQQFLTLPHDQRLIRAFQSLRPTNYQNACNAVSGLASGSAHIVGTLLVASAADSHGAARIHSLDFVTGTATLLAGSVAADGQDPTAFTSNAQALLSSRSSAGSPFQIDQWGIQCVADAVALFPHQVGWPVDLLLARRSSGGERFTVSRRVSSSPAAALTEFLVLFRSRIGWSLPQHRSAISDRHPRRQFAARPRPRRHAWQRTLD